MSELFTRPRYYRDVVFHRHTDRTVGWLELFYDLVYIATLIQIGNYLSDNLTVLGFGQLLVLMFVVWWAWSGATLYQSRYVSDDIPHRVLVLVQISGVALIGLSVSEAFGSLSVQFTVGYVLARSVMVALYARVYFTHPESRTATVKFLIGFSGGIAIWLGALALPGVYQWIAWLVAIAFEIAFFSPATMSQHVRRWAPDARHLVERFGIFTIIVLGEAFVKVLDDAQGAALGIKQVIFAIAGLVVLYALWWLYFSDTAGRLYDIASDVKPLAWSYGHLFLAVALVTFGVALKKMFAEALDHPVAAVTEEYRLVTTAAITIFLLALAMINYGLDDALTTMNQNTIAVVYLAAAPMVAAVGWFVTRATATQFAGLLALIMSGLVVFNTYQTVKSTEHHSRAA